MMRSFCVAFALGLALAQGASCPIDDSSATFTGQTRTDRATGKLLKQYKCNRAGHVFWVPSR